MPPDFDEQLERLLHRYADPIRPTRDTFAEIKERLRVKFELDGDGSYAEDDAFILEESMPGDENNRPTTTVPSPRMDTRRRGLRPRATAIAALVAVLILVIIAATIFTQLAVRRTPHPAATATPSAYTKMALPNANQRSISALAPASDGSLWYADSFGHSGKIGHLTSDGILSEFPLPAGENVKVVYIYSIVIGPDGALWFLGDDFDGSVYTRFVRRMTTNGAVTEIALPDSVKPVLLLSGPDGAIWFAEKTDKSKVGKIAADGRITEFPTLSQSKDGSIGNICVGPDQAIWYTWGEGSSDATTISGRIGRITPTGEVQEFATPYAPESITSGPDGALWYSEYVPDPGEQRFAPRKGYIGRITTSGVASEIPIDPNVGVDRILGGANGAIWFISSQDDGGIYRRFGRITPSGDVKTFAPAEGTGIAFAVAAPDALWVLDDTLTLWRYRLPA